jgi:hypothetical protein
MARASTLTLIPLDRLAEHLGISPWHFNGISMPQHPFTPACSDDWYQFNWQATGKLSREALAQALNQAEQTTERFLGYAPLPRWYRDTVNINPYYKIERRNIANSRGMSKSVYASHGYIIEPGIRTNTFISTPNVVYSDSDGDGITDLATITTATTVTDPEELRVYYPGKSGDDTWEIRPLTSVTIAAGVATITFRKWLCALQTLQEKMPTVDDPYIGIDGTDDTNFLTTVDVYRVYTDPSYQAVFWYEPDDLCTSDYEYGGDYGALLIRDERLGIMAYHRANWDAVNAKFTATDFTNYPDRVTMYYRAGKKDDTLTMPTREMDREFERLIVFYALSLLDTELCGCDNTRNIWQYQTRDFSRVDSNGSYVVPWPKLGNPLGTTFAAFRLWEQIQPMKINRPARRW